MRFPKTNRLGVSRPTSVKKPTMSVSSVLLFSYTKNQWLPYYEFIIIFSSFSLCYRWSNVQRFFFVLTLCCSWCSISIDPGWCSVFSHTNRFFFSWSFNVEEQVFHQKFSGLGHLCLKFEIIINLTIHKICKIFLCSYVTFSERYVRIGTFLHILVIKKRLFGN
jgi:hypothetical protein